MFLYTECHECNEPARLRHSGACPTLISLDKVMASILLETRVTWNDATRGAYRAQRRKDETP